MLANEIIIEAYVVNKQFEEEGAIYSVRMVTGARLPEIEAMLKNSASEHLRGIATPDRLYIGDAWDMTHETMQTALGFRGHSFRIETMGDGSWSVGKQEGGPPQYSEQEVSHYGAWKSFSRAGLSDKFRIT